jgi:hypothetical protein
MFVLKGPAMSARKTTVTIIDVPSGAEIPPAPEPTEAETWPTAHDLLDQLIEAARVLREAKKAESALRAAFRDAETNLWDAEDTYNRIDGKLRTAVNGVTQS